MKEEEEQQLHTYFQQEREGGRVNALNADIIEKSRLIPLAQL